MAVVTIIAAGAGLAFLVRSIISLEDAIDQDNEVSVQDYADSAEAQRGIEVLEAKGIPSMIRHGGFRGAPLWYVLISYYGAGDSGLREGTAGGGCVGDAPLRTLRPQLKRDPLGRA